jgi:uncharacterized protein YndB with AHSA1/START domain
MIDIAREIQAVQREVGTRGGAEDDTRTLRVRRTYQAPIDDVWDALTNPGRIGRWFLPISGDYRIGGHFQFEGNAGGEIVGCDRPNRLELTWGDRSGDHADMSRLELRLTAPDADHTTFELVHTAAVPQPMWDEYGPGAVGVGWEGGLLGLELHLRGGSIDDPIAWQLSDEGRAFNTASSEAWGAANRSAGATAETVARNIASTTAFYTTPPA